MKKNTVEWYDKKNEQMEVCSHLNKHVIINKRYLTIHGLNKNIIYLIIIKYIYFYVSHIVTV